MDTALAVWAMVASVGGFASLFLWGLQYHRVKDAEFDTDYHRAQATNYRTQYEKQLEEVQRLQDELDAVDVELVGHINDPDLAGALSRGGVVHENEVHDGDQTGPVPSWVDGEDTKPGDLP